MQLLRANKNEKFRQQEAEKEKEEVEKEKAEVEKDKAEKDAQILELKAQISENSALRGIIKEKFVCTISFGILIEPQATTCGHIFCCPCLLENSKI